MTKPKIWFITGISSGLGKALAQAVIENSDFVIGTFRKQSEVDQFNKVNAGKGFSMVLDLASENKINKAVEKLLNKFGRIDVLVNNAGVGFTGAIEEANMEEVRDVFEINFFGTLALTKAILPHMRKQKSGHIVQISSHGGIKAFAGFGIYNASKFALEGFSEALAQEVSPLGIKLSMIEPGPFRTGFAGDRLKLAAKIIDDYSETAGVFRSKLKGVDGKQEGDPAKASKAIINLVESEEPSLRLPLGKTALITIGMKMDSVKADLEASKLIAEQAVYE
jgi:short-subunit dehydrogenase